MSVTPCDTPVTTRPVTPATAGELDTVVTGGAPADDPSGARADSDTAPPGASTRKSGVTVNTPEPEEKAADTVCALFIVMAQVPVPAQGAPHPLKL